MKKNIYTAGTAHLHKVSNGDIDMLYEDHSAKDRKENKNLKIENEKKPQLKKENLCLKLLGSAGALGLFSTALKLAGSFIQNAGRTFALDTAGNCGLLAAFGLLVASSAVALHKDKKEREKVLPENKEQKLGK